MNKTTVIFIVSAVVFFISMLATGYANSIGHWSIVAFIGMAAFSGMTSFMSFFRVTMEI
jgi:hypothetical protein